MKNHILSHIGSPAVRPALLLLIVAALAVTAAEPALAQQTSGAFAPLETAVQMIVDFITGPFGRLLAIIAVIGLGFLAFAGRLSWFTAGAVVIGIGLVFGAPAIVDQMISAVGK
ncbi:MAG: VIRB2 type IV secretion [Mesorhizobium sp.]|uniref:TrbC/VirB2 family protein n=1 Tax=unclassified Mesorhizobium TaxID=325217 RepID=UPI000F752AF4|nr:MULTISPECIES: TrbC/VirB2 family protein [unclassified Mesorhizobium]AZO22605.1 VIRB2 type IV secretion [Mesorhizobium sp. M1E.F.Ca.ET.045.02.1.1]RWD52348.1 MAG: VIRB2 type IV secretion [Mesorhizobium sp.]RWE81314.1 MAG: VIRB2 type IV secretion [Mesorhizobium sp.]TIU00952.1 MAG: VIRB2 type IV secretion [Mesorhizobium sp.]TIU59459.1 MAG: VIRB2 type IV secretion [Mesorhizobium sp.]